MPCVEVGYRLAREHWGKGYATEGDIGMSNANEDFDHPALPEGSELRRHCLYRISREAWLRKAESHERKISKRNDAPNY